MTVWIILTIMTSAAAVLVSAPLLRRIDERRAVLSGDVEVYRDQLKEVEKEAADGLIDGDQADTARIEIKRRILAADGADNSALVRLSLADRNVAVIAVAAIVVLGSVGLYALNGRPELPSAPASAKSAGAGQPNTVERLATLTASQVTENQQESGSQTPLATVDAMIDRLVERLKRKPDDPEGWRMLGWSYFSTERYAESAVAYAKAIEQSPNIADFRSSRGEALVRAANGQVTEEAKNVFEGALKLDPKDPRARFFKGLAKEQAGEKTAALDDWVVILNEADPNEAWVADLAQRATELGREIGVDVTSRLRRPQAAAGGGVLGVLKQQAGDVPNAARKGPSAEDVSAAEAMAPSDRMAMIRGMVEGLANRLEQSPRDAEGWIKLIRSRTVLGETDAAKQALDRALKVFGDAPQEQARIAASARELGLVQ